MPRKAGVFIEGGIHPVYCGASRGEAVFADEVEAASLVDVLQKVRGDGRREVRVAGPDGAGHAFPPLCRRRAVQLRSKCGRWSPIGMASSTKPAKIPSRYHCSWWIALR